MSELASLIKFHQNCNQKLRNVDEILGIMEENKQNMTRTKIGIAALMSNYTTVSSELHIFKNIY